MTAGEPSAPEQTVFVPQWLRKNSSTNTSQAFDPRAPEVNAARKTALVATVQAAREQIRGPIVLTEMVRAQKAAPYVVDRPQDAPMPLGVLSSAQSRTPRQT